MSKTIIILGAGAGISQSVAKLFGENGFSVALVGRSVDKLNAFVTELKQKGINAQSFAADVSNANELQLAIQNIKNTFGRIDVVHYNAAALRMVNVLEETADTLIKDFAVNVAGLQTAALATMQELATNQGAIIATGGGFASYPQADFASLSIGKAGIKNLSSSLAQVLNPKGIFVGVLTINGYVSPDAEIHNPDNIAHHFWQLYADRTDFERQL